MVPDVDEVLLGVYGDTAVDVALSSHAAPNFIPFQNRFVVVCFSGYKSNGIRLAEAEGLQGRV